jgi:hypothetical protein
MFDRIAVRVSAFLCLSLFTAGVCFADLPAPVAVPLSVVTAQKTSVQISLIGQHTTGGGFTYSIKTMPSHGQLSTLVDNHVTYTPDNGYAGNDSFTYSVTDSVGESNPATVAITVSPAAAPVVSLPALSAFALCAMAALLAGIALRNRAFV